MELTNCFRSFEITYTLEGVLLNFIYKYVFHINFIIMINILVYLVFLLK